MSKIKLVMKVKEPCDVVPKEPCDVVPKDEVNLIAPKIKLIMRKTPIVIKMIENKSDEFVVKPIVPIGNILTDLQVKTCPGCGDDKPKSDYDKRCSLCKICEKLRRQKIATTQKLTRQTILDDPVARNVKKTCEKCHQEKTVIDFRDNRLKCIICERDENASYRRNNPQVQKAWDDAHPHAMDVFKAKWYQEHKSDINKELQNRYENDPVYKIKKAHSRVLQINIKRLSTGTGNKISATFGRTAHWLHWNFSGDMSWENHGTNWVVDHVIPMNKWDITNTDQQDMCFNWKNLSPLGKSDNRQKSAKIIHESIVNHKAQLRKYFKENELEMEELNQYIQKYDEKLISLGETP